MTPAVKMQLVWLALYFGLVTVGWWNSKQARARVAGRTGHLYVAITLFFAPFVMSGLPDAIINGYIDTDDLSQHVLFKGPVLIALLAALFAIERKFNMIDLMKEAYGRDLNP